MKTYSKSTNCHLNLKWQFKDNTHICITDNKIIINTKTGRIIKETVCSYSKGYWIGRKFFTKERINKEVKLIKEIDCPF